MIEAQVFDGFWPYNPSIHRDQNTGLIRCTARHSNYALPMGKYMRAPDVRVQLSKNTMMILNPATLQPTEIREMRELDTEPRAKMRGMPAYQDIRLFMCKGELCGIASSRQLQTAKNLLWIETILLGLDDDYDVVAAKPLRGAAWANRDHKNWMPFEGAEVPRFLCSVERGVVIDFDGCCTTQAPTALQALRGGSQLLEVAPDRWFGIVHETVVGQKFYWHRFMLCDWNGKLLELSEPFKIVPNHPIEFAVGIAIDSDEHQLMISYGIDDMEAWVGTMPLEAALELLRPL
jgi:hypothetical protein